MKKPYNKKNLIFNAAILLILAVAIFLQFKPYITTPDFRIDEVRDMDHRIASVSAQNVVGMLQGNDRPVMLVLYASWCPICQKRMPDIVDAIREEKLGNVIPVFVSMDSQPRELSKYLVYHDYNNLFVPYMIEQTFFNGLPSALQTTGSHFSGAIPYVGFFDANGKIMAEMPDGWDKQTLLDTAHKLTNTEQ